MAHHQPALKIQASQLNWSHFKPELTGKPDEDAEADLLRPNDWMDTHVFSEGIKVQRFCLTVLGEARLWHESLMPIALGEMVYKISLDNNIQR